MSSLDNSSDIYKDIHDSIKDKQKKQKKKTGILKPLLIIAVILFIAVAGVFFGKNLFGGNKMLKTPASAKEFCGRNYEDVVNQLEDAGFTNIETAEMDKSMLDFFNAGKVEEISIAGDTKFEKGVEFAQDEKIRIKYHPPKESEDSEETE